MDEFYKLNDIAKSIEYYKDPFKNLPQLPSLFQLNYFQIKQQHEQAEETKKKADENIKRLMNQLVHVVSQVNRRWDLLRMELPDRKIIKIGEELKLMVNDLIQHYPFTQEAVGTIYQYINQNTSKLQKSKVRKNKIPKKQTTPNTGGISQEDIKNTVKNITVKNMRNNNQEKIRNTNKKFSHNPLNNKNAELEMIQKMIKKIYG